MSGDVFTRYARLYPVYVAFARHRGHEDPRGFAQEVFARTLKGRYEDQGWRPETWLNTIARNLMADYWRHRSNRALEHAPQPTCTIDRYPCEDEYVRRAVATLPERQRLVLWLRYWVGYNTAQTGIALGVSAGTVKALQHRAEAGLRLRMEAE